MTMTANPVFGFDGPFSKVKDLAAVLRRLREAGHSRKASDYLSAMEAGLKLLGYPQLAQELVSVRSALLKFDWKRILEETADFLYVLASGLASLEAVGDIPVFQSTGSSDTDADSLFAGMEAQADRIPVSVHVVADTSWRIRRREISVEECIRDTRHITDLVQFWRDNQAKIHEGAQRPIVRFVMRRHEDVFADLDAQTRQDADTLLECMATGRPVPQGLDPERVNKALARIIRILEFAVIFVPPPYNIGVQLLIVGLKLWLARRLKPSEMTWTLLPRSETGMSAKAKEQEAGATMESAVLGEDIDVIIKLFDSDFKVDEVWKSLRAVATLGEKSEQLLRSLNLIKGPSSCGPIMNCNMVPKFAAASIRDDEFTDAELVSDLKHKLESQPKQTTAGEASTFKLDPALAALLMKLASIALQKLLDKWLKPAT